MKDSPLSHHAWTLRSLCCVYSRLHKLTFGEALPHHWPPDHLLSNFHAVAMSIAQASITATITLHASGIFACQTLTCIILPHSWRCYYYILNALLFLLACFFFKDYFIRFLLEDKIKTQLHKLITSLIWKPAPTKSLTTWNWKLHALFQALVCFPRYHFSYVMQLFLFVISSNCKLNL